MRQGGGRVRIATGSPQLEPLCLPWLVALTATAAELVRQRPTFTEGRLEDGTPTCPRIRLAVAEAPASLPGLEQHKTVTWRVGGRDTEHVMLFLSVRHLAAGRSGRSRRSSTDKQPLARSTRWHAQPFAQLALPCLSFRSHTSFSSTCRGTAWRRCCMQQRPRAPAAACSC